MNRIFFPVLITVLLITDVYAQQTDRIEPLIKQIELISPWVVQGTRTVHSRSRHRQSCFDLIRLKQMCDGPEPLSYGNRIGDNWDIFATDGGGRNSRTRMIEVGKYKWTDQFEIPEVEPWSELKPGELRHIKIALFGADGKPGRNGDGSYPAGPPPREGNGSAPVSRQVTSTITVSGKSVRGDGYIPYNEVKLGHMFLVHVVNQNIDHYVLIRVDELVRGERVVFSYFKLGPPIP